LREFVGLKFDLDILNVSHDIDIIDISRYLQDICTWAALYKNLRAYSFSS